MKIFIPKEFTAKNIFNCIFLRVGLESRVLEVFLQILQQLLLTDVTHLIQNCKHFHETTICYDSTPMNEYSLHSHHSRV